MAQSIEPLRSQSSTSLYKLYNGPNGGINSNQIAEEELQDPRLNYCNAFWGPGDRGFDVIMARLRGAGRTVEELRAFWKERWVRSIFLMPKAETLAIALLLRTSTPKSLTSCLVSPWVKMKLVIWQILSNICSLKQLSKHPTIRH